MAAKKIPSSRLNVAGGVASVGLLARESRVVPNLTDLTAQRATINAKIVENKEPLLDYARAIMRRNKKVRVVWFAVDRKGLPITVTIDEDALTETAVRALNPDAFQVVKVPIVHRKQRASTSTYLKVVVGRQNPVSKRGNSMIGTINNRY